MKLFKKFTKMLEMPRIPRVLAHVQDFRWQPPYRYLSKLRLHDLRALITLIILCKAAALQKLPLHGSRSPGNDFYDKPNHFGPALIMR